MSSHTERNRPVPLPAKRLAAGPVPSATAAILMGKVARRYYLEGRSKVEIAQEVGISRFKVARLLDEALATGLVRIEINPSARSTSTPRPRRKDALGLDHVVVVTVADPRRPPSDARSVPPPPRCSARSSSRPRCPRPAVVPQRDLRHGPGAAQPAAHRGGAGEAAPRRSRVRTPAPSVSCRQPASPAPATRVLRPHAGGRRRDGRRAAPRAAGDGRPERGRAGSPRPSSASATGHRASPIYDASTEADREQRGPQGSSARWPRSATTRGGTSCGPRSTSA